MSVVNGHARSGIGKRFGGETPATADIEHACSRERSPLAHELQADRVQLVQRPEFAARIPETVGERIELREFRGIGARGHAAAPTDRRAGNSRVMAASSSASKASRRLSRSIARPATQTSVTAPRPAA